MITDRVIPNGHWLTRRYPADEPMGPPTADPGYLLRSLVRDFAGLGWSTDQLVALIRSPAHPALNRLVSHFGRSGVRRRVDDLLAASDLLGPSGVSRRHRPP